MFPSRRVVVGLLCLLAVAALILVVDERPAWSLPDEAPRPGRFDYTTSSVESGALQGKLTELGLEGWEVFSIERSTAAVEEGPNSTTRLVVDHFQVTARRPVKS